MKKLTHLSIYILAASLAFAPVSLWAMDSQEGRMPSKAFYEELSSVMKMDFEKSNLPSLKTELEFKIKEEPNNGRYQEALGLVEYGLKNYQGAVGILKDLKPMPLMGNKALALSYLELNDLGNAEKHFANIPKITISQEHWNNYCEILVQNGKKESAAKEYEYFLIKYPKSPKALEFLIQYYKEPLNKDKLLPKLHMAITHNPNESKYYLELARLYENNHPMALMQREKYLKLKPDDNEVKLEIAQILEGKNQIKRALEFYDEVTPHYKHDWEFCKKVSNVWLSQGNKKKAIALMEEAYKQNIGDKHLPNQLAQLYREEGIKDKAAELMLSQVMEKPKNEMLQTELLAYVETSFKNESAISKLQSWEYNFPNQTAIHLKIAGLYLDAKNKEKAYEYATRALASSPDNVEALKIIPLTITDASQIYANMENLKKLESKKIESEDNWFLLAEGYFSQNDIKNSYVYYKKLYNKNPKRLLGNYNASLVAEQSQNFKMAFEIASQYKTEKSENRNNLLPIYINSSIKNEIIDEALLAALEDFRKLQPSSDKWWFVQAQLENKFGKAENSIASAEKAMLQNPDDIAVNHFVMEKTQDKAKYKNSYKFALENLERLIPKNNSEYKYKIAQVYIEEKLFDVALQKLEAINKQYKNQDNYWYMQAQCQSKMGMIDQAKENYKKAVQMSPDNIQFVKAYVASLDKNTEFKSELNLIEKAAKKDPSLEEIDKLATSYFLNGKFADAAKTFDMLASKNKTKVSENSFAGEAYFKAEKYAKAEPLYEAKLKENAYDINTRDALKDIYTHTNQNKKYLENLEQIVNLDPAYKDYQLQLAKLYLLNKKPEKAFSPLENWISRQPKDKAALEMFHKLAQDRKDTLKLAMVLDLIAATPNPETQYLTQRAEIAFNQNRDITYLTQCVKAFPEYNNGKEILIKYYSENQQYKELSEFENYMVKNQNRIEYLTALTNMYVVLNNKSKASEYYYLLYNTNPKNKDVFASAIQQQKDSKSDYLVKTLELGYKSFPSDLNVKFQYAEALGENDKAIGIYKEILKADPNHLEAAKNGLKVSSNLKQDKNQEHFLLANLKIVPSDAKTLRSLVDVYIKLDKKATATKYFEMLLQYSSLTPESGIELAEIYQQVPDVQKALSTYDRVLQIDPTNEKVQKASVELLEGLKDTKQLKAGLIKLQNYDPSLHEYQYQISKLSLEEKKKGEAFQYLSKALATQPKNYKYIRLLPSVISEPDQALQYFEPLRALAREKSVEAETWMHLGSAYYLKGNLENSGEMYAKAYEANNDILLGSKMALQALYHIKDYAKSVKLASAYIKGNKEKDIEVLSIYASSLDATKADSKVLREAIYNLVESNPAENSWWFKLAGLDLEFKDSSKAIVHGKKWLEFNTEDKQAMLFLKPLLETKSSEKETLAFVLGKLIVLDAKNANQYHFQLGKMAFKDKNYFGSIEHFETAKKDYSNNSSFNYMLGTSYHKSNNPVEAKKYLAESYKLDSGNKKYATAYAEYLIEDKELKNNLSLFELLTKNKPNTVQRIQYAKALYLNGKASESAKQWDVIQKEDPKYAESTIMAANAYLESQRYPEAWNQYKKWVEKDPFNQKHLEIFYDLSLKNKKAQEAHKSLEQLVNLNPDLKDYQWQLASSFVEKKDNKNAKYHFEQYIARTKNQDAILEFYALNKSTKDTARIMQSLDLLVATKAPEQKHILEHAELNFYVQNNIDYLEKAVKKYPEYNEGKRILVGEYYKRGNYEPLADFTKYMDENKKSEPSFYKALAEAYKVKNIKELAIENYFMAFKTEPKSAELYAKTIQYCNETKCGIKLDILNAGHTSFPENFEIALAAAMETKEPKAALKLYEDALKLNNGSFEARTGAAKNAFKLKDYKTATPHLEQWVKVQPEFEAWEMLATSYNKTKQDEKYADAVAQIAALKPDVFNWSFEAGMAFKKINKEDKSFDFFMNAVALNPKNPEAQKELGLLMAKRKQWPEAIKALKFAKSKLDFNEELSYSLYKSYQENGEKKNAYEEILLLNKTYPDNLRYASYAAEYELENKNHGQVAQILNHNSLKGKLDSKASFMLLNSLVELNNTSEAGVVVKYINLKFAEEASNSFSMAKFYYQQKNLDKAKEIFDRLHGKSPTVESFYYLGNIAYLQQNYEVASKYLPQAVEFDKEVMNLAAESFEKTNKNGDAIIAYETYYQDSKKLKTLEKLFVLYQNAKDQSGTIRTLERILEADPKNDDYRVELANIYIGLQENKKMEAQFKIILKRNPFHPKANLIMGKIHAKQGNHKTSIKMLKIALKTYSKDWEAYYLLGESYDASKNDKMAYKNYEKAAALNPKHMGSALQYLHYVKKLGYKNLLTKAYEEVAKLDSHNFEAAKYLAELKFKERKYNEASIYYSVVLEKESQKFQNWSNYAMALEAINKPQEAKRAYMQAIQLGEKNNLVLIRLTGLQISDKDYPEAESILSSIIQSDKKFHKAYYQKAKIARLNNQHEMAESMINQAISLKPGYPDYMQELGQIKYDQGKYFEAVEAMAKATGPYNLDGKKLFAKANEKAEFSDAAIKTYKEIFKEEPLEETMVTLTDLIIKTKNSEEVFSIVEKSPFKDNYSGKVQLAKAHAKNGEYEKAINILEEFEDDKDRLAQTHFELGNIYSQEGDYKKAIKEFNKAQKARSNYMEATFETGMAWIYLKKWEKAEEEFKALSASNDARWKAKAHFGNAKIKEHQKDYAGMVEELKKSMEVVFNWESMYLLTQGYIYMKDIPSAETLIGEVHNINKDHPITIAAKAELLLSKNRKNDAFRLLQRGLENHPRSCDLVLQLAKVNWRMGNFKNVSSSSKFALSVCPDKPEPYLLLGYVAHKEYNSKEAKKQFKLYEQRGGNLALLPEEFR